MITAMCQVALEMLTHLILLTILQNRYYQPYFADEETETQTYVVHTSSESCEETPESLALESRHLIQLPVSFFICKHIPISQMIKLKHREAK